MSEENAGKSALVTIAGVLRQSGRASSRDLARLLGKSRQEIEEIALLLWKKGLIRYLYGSWMGLVIKSVGREDEIDELLSKLEKMPDERKCCECKFYVSVCPFKSRCTRFEYFQRNWEIGYPQEEERR